MTAGTSGHGSSGLAQPTQAEVSQVQHAQKSGNPGMTSLVLLALQVLYFWHDNSGTSGAVLAGGLIPAMHYSCASP